MLDDWTYIQYIASMTISKTYPVGRSGKRLQAEFQGQRKESGWATVGRWALAFAVALLVSVQADARAVKTDQVIEGRIVGVLDGDTVDMLTDDLMQQRIRLRGIDAPEKRQAFGNRSKQALSALVFGRRVTVAYSKVDRYGRWVGRITVNGVDVSRAMVEQGTAWRYAFYELEQPVQERVGDAEAEHAARLERRGLWRDEAPMAPWDFRQSGRRAIER